MYDKEAGLDPAHGNSPGPPPPEHFTKPSVARNAYLNFKDMQVVPSVRQLHQTLPPVTRAALCSDVLNLFIRDSSIYAIPIIDEAMAPCALIERHAYIEYFSRTYSIEVFGRKPLAQIVDIAPAINKSPIVVDASTSIDDVAAIIVDAGMQHMVSGFIVTEANKYLGIANGHSLLNSITQRKQPNQPLPEK